MMSERLIAMLLVWGKLITSRYIAESIITDAGHFIHVARLLSTAYKKKGNYSSHLAGVTTSYR